MTAHTIHAYPSHDGTAGGRDHVFVLPAVICTTLLAKRVASATGAVTIRHQDGCGHIGDDVAHGSHIYSSLGDNPNVCATLVLSLGCETLQGAAVAADLKQRGVPTEVLRLQANGAVAVEHDATVAVHHLRRRHHRDRTPLPIGALRVGIVADRADERLETFIAMCSNAGADVVVAGTATSELPSNIERTEASTDGLQRLSILAAAATTVIVSFPHPDEAPFSVSLVPVVTVGSGSALHDALKGDFDISRPSPAALWQLVLETVEGRATAAERAGRHSFSLPRLRRTM